MKHKEVLLMQLVSFKLTKKDLRTCIANLECTTALQDYHTQAVQEECIL